MRTRKGAAAGLLLGALGAMGCGGGSALDAAPPATSTSFSPAVGTTAAGATADVWWKHRINGGVGTAVVSDGTPLTLTFADRLTRVTAGGTKREITVGLSLAATDGSGVVSHLSGTTEDTVVPGPPSATVDETMHQDQQITGEGMSVQVAVQLMATFTMPVVDFGDRTDLDQLPVGHVDEATVRSVVTGSASTTANGTRSTQSVSSSTDLHEVWTVMAQLPSMTVLGTTYARVVEVELHTDSTDADTLAVSQSTNTLWLAAGVGIIKELQSNDYTPSPFTIELVDTNLGLN